MKKWEGSAQGRRDGRTEKLGREGKGREGMEIRKDQPEVRTTWGSDEEL